MTDTGKDIVVSPKSGCCLMFCRYFLANCWQRNLYLILGKPKGSLLVKNCSYSRYEHLYIIALLHAITELNINRPI